MNVIVIRSPVCCRLNYDTCVDPISVAMICIQVGRRAICQIWSQVYKVTCLQVHTYSDSGCVRPTSIYSHKENPRLRESQKHRFKGFRLNKYPSSVLTSSSINCFSTISSRQVHCSSNPKMSRLFQEADHAELYIKYRPTYSQQMFDTIFNFCEQGKSETGKPAPDAGCGSGHDKAETGTTALDVGCGSGQSTRPLCDRFEQVLGLDISNEQIRQASKALPGVRFHVGAAEDLSFCEDNSVDLVTIGQALHWLDTARFYLEVTRVLKPGGTLAAYGYGNNEVNIPEAQKLVTEVRSVTL
jgi:2-polyprenyl-3-methyl-5-hydroxy-6-metoxy-1,4-benzoquinol methylase